MDIMEFLNSDYMVMLLIPTVMALLQAIKVTGLVPPKFIPLASLLLGILAGVVYSGFTVKEGILIGIFIGTTAIGVFSGSKNIYEGIKKDPHQ